MQRVLFAVLVAMLAAATELTDDDPDSDPARFMIVVEHVDSYQCAAALISIRTGVTTARCARPRGEGHLWAYAASLVSARPPPSLAVAARRVSRVAFAGDGSDPADPALDIALLELEEPFGVEATSQPILMATSRKACEVPLCHAVRALPALNAKSVPGRRARLRVVSLTRAPDKSCAARVPQWPVSRPRSMCLTGDMLCERDLGGGVVCGGKLCGVLSAVAGEGKAGGQACGDTLAAQSVAHWRRFFHCAYTFHLCGSGTCVGQCTEQRLLADVKDTSLTFVAAFTETTELKTRFKDTFNSLGLKIESTQVTTLKQHFRTPVQEDIVIERDQSTGQPTRSPPPLPPPSPRPVHSFSAVNPSWPPRSPSFRLTTPGKINLFEISVDSHQASSRPSAVFEPNRPDFKAATNQTTRVGLKAGEYGDNVADYGEEAPPAPAHTPTPPAPALPVHNASSASPSAAVSSRSEPPAPAARALHAAAPQLSASRSAPSAHPTFSFSVLCIVMTFLYYYNLNKKV